MKFKNLILAAIAVIAAAACSGKEEPLPAAGISVDKSSVELEASVSKSSVSLTATRDWVSKVTYEGTAADWLSVTPASGSASSKAQSVEITALANDGFDRSATIKFSIGLADAVVTVSQKGSKVKTYKTLADVRAYCNANGVNADSNINLPEDYLVKASFISNQAVLDNLNSNKSCYVQDETDGLNIFFAANNTFEFGDVVEIDLSKAGMKLYGGVLEVDGLALDAVTKVGTSTPAPKSVSMADYLANKYESQYITIDAPVQAKSSSATQTWYSGTANAASIYFIDADGNEFQVRSSKYATYGSENVPTGSGKISGIASTFNGSAQLYFAQASDYASLTGERFSVKAEDHSDAPATTVADFISKADKSNYYKLTGTVSNFSSNYCSFDLKDATGTIYVYSVDNKDEWSSKIKNGGTVVLAGQYDYYASKSQHEVVHAQIISFEEASVETVSCEGQVVAVSSKAFLVKTSTGFAYAFSADKAPTVKVGDNVKLSGEKSMYGSLEEVVNYTVEVVSSGTVEYPAPTSIDGAAMNTYSNMFGYVTFTGKLEISGNYYNINVNGSSKTGSLSNATGVDASLNGKIVDVTGYFIGLTGSDKYFNIILTSIKASDDQTGAGEGGSTGGGSDTPGTGDAPSLTAGENEVLHLLSKEEITAVTKDATASGTVYGDHDIASEGGKWTGNFAVSKTNDFLQMRNNNASYLTSPEYSSKVVRVVLVATESKYKNSTDFTRNIYAVPVVDPAKLPTGKTADGKSNLNYTEAEWSTNYGKTQFTSKGGAQLGEIKFNADTDQFSIISADGAVYFDAIYVFCEK